MNVKQVVLSLLAVSSLGFGAAHAQSLTVSTSEASPGELIRVKVVADAGVVNINGIQFILDFSTKSPGSAPGLSLYSDDDITVNSPMFGGAILTMNPQPTTLPIAIAGIEVKKGPGTVLSVPFRVPENAPAGAKYTFRLRNLATSFSGPSIPLTLKDGSVTVKNPSFVGLTGSNASGYPGGDATVAFNITELAKNVAGVQFKLSFDPSLTVKAEDVETTGFISGAPVVKVEPGSVRIAVASNAGKNGPGVFAKVKFHLPADATVGKEYPVSVSDLVMAGLQGNLNATAVGGKVTVEKKPGPVNIEGGLVSVKSVTARKGEMAKIAVAVNEKITNLSGASFKLVYSMKTPDTAPDLQYEGDEVAGGVIPGASPLVNTSTAGELTVALAAVNGSTRIGNLVVLPFRVPDTAAGGTVYTFQLKDVLLSVDGKDYTSAAEGGTLTVAGRKKGDISNVGDKDQGDDRIDTMDAIALLRIIIKSANPTDDQAQAADANCDGTVSVSDVVKILKIAVGLEGPCEG